jgi:hypothetical protein
MSVKNTPGIPSGIEPATFRPVEQCLSQLRRQVPSITIYSFNQVMNHYSKVMKSNYIMCIVRVALARQGTSDIDIKCKQLINIKVKGHPITGHEGTEGE